MGHDYSKRNSIHQMADEEIDDEFYEQLERLQRTQPEKVKLKEPQV